MGEEGGETGRADSICADCHVSQESGTAMEALSTACECICRPASVAQAVVGVVSRSYRQAASEQHSLPSLLWSAGYAKVLSSPETAPTPL